MAPRFHGVRRHILILTPIGHRQKYTGSEMIAALDERGMTSGFELQENEKILYRRIPEIIRELTDHPEYPGLNSCSGLLEIGPILEDAYAGLRTPYSPRVVEAYMYGNCGLESLAEFTKELGWEVRYYPTGKIIPGRPK